MLEAQLKPKTITSANTKFLNAVGALSTSLVTNIPGEVLHSDYNALKDKTIVT